MRNTIERLVNGKYFLDSVFPLPAISPVNLKIVATHFRMAFFILIGAWHLDFHLVGLFMKLAFPHY